jgi:opacity protein-like surface antigen
MRYGAVMIRHAIAAALALAAPAAASAQNASAWRVELEAGATFQTRNSAQVRGDTGTRFDLDRLQGSPVSPLLRAAVEFDPWARHGFRVAYQYLRNEGTGTLPGVTSFAGGVFQPGVATKGEYRFDTWRATYRYTLWRGETLRVRIGLTGLLRDAEIRLTQNGQTRRDADVGFVPLLHASFDWRFAPRWTLMGDIDALGASQGRAVDLGLRVAHDVSRSWQVMAGWRFLDGGVDNDSVYNFARFHSLTAGLAYRF